VVRDVPGETDPFQQIFKRTFMVRSQQALDRLGTNKEDVGQRRWRRLDDPLLSWQMGARPGGQDGRPRPLSSRPTRIRGMKPAAKHSPFGAIRQDRQPFR
jgi:hypothetical protein